jgi:hypothetical protein
MVLALQNGLQMPIACLVFFLISDLMGLVALKRFYLWVSKDCLFVNKNLVVDVVIAFYFCDNIFFFFFFNIYTKQNHHNNMTISNKPTST